MMTATLVKSCRLGAKPWLKDEHDYTYRRRAEYKKNNIIYFTCTERMDLCCKAAADYNTVTGSIVQFRGEHTHQPNPQKLRAMLEEVTVVQNVVDTVATQQAKPQQILSKVLKNLEASNSTDSIQYVSSKESLRSKTRRAKIKAKLALPDKIPTTWKALKERGLPPSLTTMQTGSQFLRYFGPVKDDGEEIMALFASEFGIHLLKQATTISADGTFQTCPAPFCQLFVLQAQLVRGKNYPVVFALLPDKTTASYMKFFTEVKKLSPDMFTTPGLPSMVSVDFERPIWTAITAVLPAAAISGCQFHFARNIDNNVASKKLGELRKKSPPLGHAIRMIKALVHLPEEKVDAGFMSILNYLDQHTDELVALDPEFIPKLKSLAWYMRKFYIGGPDRASIYPIPTWNKHAETLAGKR